MFCAHFQCIRPYHVENTSSRLITEVKQHWAALVLGWVTAWEYAVLYAFYLLFCLVTRPGKTFLTSPAPKGPGSSVGRALGF